MIETPDGFDKLCSTAAAKRYLARKRRSAPNALLPLSFESDPRRLTPESYLHSTDPRALRLIERLEERLNKEFPPDVRPSGFCGSTAVPTDWNGLRNVSGIGMDPLPIPIYDNARFIEKSGLKSAIEPGDVPWLKEIIRLFHCAAAPADVLIRKAASTSFPYFAKDISYKKLAALKALCNIDDYLAKACANDRGSLEAWLQDYHACYLYAIHLRQQPNAILHKEGRWSSKPRTAPTEREARSGLYTGNTFADMTVHDANGHEIEGHFAMRQRDVFGLNGPLNYVLSAFWGCFRAVYLDRFAFTYKVRGDQDKAERMRSYRFVVGSDVKTMDKLVPRWFIDFYTDELHQYLDERVVKLFRRAYAAPYVAPNPWRATPPSYSPFFGPSPLEPWKFDAHVGLPSGIGPNPDIGKLWMTLNYVLVGRSVGALLRPTDIEPFLMGKNPKLCLLDTADDAAFGTDTQERADALKRATTPYAILEPETPVIYLGGVFTETSAGMDVFPNPVTFLVNLLCREDSISQKGPAVWAEGYEARCAVYSRTPIFRDLMRIWEEVCREEVGINPTLMARALAGRRPPVDIDAMVLADPTTLHYKVDPKDVSPEVLDSIVGKVPAADFINEVRHLFKVPLGEVK